MAVEEILTMSQKELKRLHIIHKAIEKGITQQGAAELLEIGERHDLPEIKMPPERPKKGNSGDTFSRFDERMNWLPLVDEFRNWCLNKETVNSENF